MKARLLQSVRQEITDYICTVVCRSLRMNPKSLSVMSESLQPNKKMTLEDRKNSCWISSRSMRSLRISDQVSILKERDLMPYWTESADKILKKLLLPIKTDSVDLVSTCSRNSVSLMEQRSWFSISQSYPPMKNLCRTSAQLFMFSPVEFTASGDTLRRLKKIRVYPKTKDQKKILNSFCDASRYYYNKTVEFLKQPGIKASRFAIQKDILAEVPEWASKVPYKVKQMAIEDACTAVKNAKKKFRETGQFNEVHFRKKKFRRDSFYVPKGSVHSSGIYKRILGDLRITESIENIEFDCRFLHDNGKYWVCIPYKKNIKVPDNQRKPLISLDPGVRTFLTGFTMDGFCEIGAKDFNRIFRLLIQMDKLISKHSKGSKIRYVKAINSIRFKVQNLISEMHHKVSNILVRCFDRIIIPEFSAKGTILNKLRSKTCRSMLTWAHSKFRELLTQKAFEYSAEVIFQNEAYTSKTCSFCGKLHNIGSKKILKCSCGAKIDRDWNGARGIFLRALLDQPELQKLCIS